MYGADELPLMLDQSVFSIRMRNTVRMADVGSVVVVVGGGVVVVVVMGVLGGAVAVGQGHRGGSLAVGSAERGYGHVVPAGYVVAALDVRTGQVAAVV